MSQPAFGRRSSPPTEEPGARQVFGRAKSGDAPKTVALKPVAAPKPLDGAVMPAEAPLRPAEEAATGPDLSVEEELEEWKRARRFPVPWRQLSLMATLCLGAATLVLPDNVEQPVELLLYVLTAASMAATVAAWWKKLTHVI